MNEWTRRLVKRKKGASDDVSGKRCSFVTVKYIATPVYNPFYGYEMAT